MVYAVKDSNNEVHLVSLLSGYENWEVVGEVEIDGRIGFSDGKIVCIDYIDKRREAYPPIQDQLDMMFHDFDAWKALISEIKSRFPKP